MKLPVLVHSTDQGLGIKFRTLLSNFKAQELLFLPKTYFDSPFIGHCPFYAMLFVRLDENTYVYREIREFCDNLERMDKELQYLVVLVPHDKYGSVCPPEKYHKAQHDRVKRHNVIVKYDEKFDQILQTAAYESADRLYYRLTALDDKKCGAQRQELVSLYANSLILRRYYNYEEFYSFLRQLSFTLIDDIDGCQEDMPVVERDGDGFGALFYAESISSETMLGVIERYEGKPYFSILQAKEAPILNFEVNGVIMNDMTLYQIVKCEQFFQEINNGNVTFFGFLTFVFCLAVNCYSNSAEEIFVVYQFILKRLKNAPRAQVWRYQMANILLSQRINPMFYMYLRLEIIVALKRMYETLCGVGFGDMVIKFQNLIRGHPDQDIRSFVFSNDVLLCQYFKMFTRCDYSYYLQTQALFYLLQHRESLLSACQDHLQQFLEQLKFLPGLPLDFMRTLLLLESDGYIAHRCAFVSLIEECTRKVHQNDTITQSVFSANLSLLFAKQQYCQHCNVGCLQRLLVYAFLFDPDHNTRDAILSSPFYQQSIEQHFAVSYKFKNLARLKDISFLNAACFYRNKLRVFEITDDDRNVMSFVLQQELGFKHFYAEFYHSSFEPSERRVFRCDITGETNQMQYQFDTGIHDTDYHYVLTRASVSFEGALWFDILETKLYKSQIASAILILYAKSYHFEFQPAQEVYVHTIPMQHHFIAELEGKSLYYNCFQTINIQIYQNINMSIELYLLVPTDLEAPGRKAIEETGLEITEQPFSCDLEKFCLSIPIYCEKSSAAVAILVKSNQQEQNIRIPLVFQKLFNVKLQISLGRVSTFFQPLYQIDFPVDISFRTGGVESTKQMTLSAKRQYCVSNTLERALEDIDFGFQITSSEFRFSMCHVIANKTFVHVVNRQLGAYQLMKPFALIFRLCCGAGVSRRFKLRAEQFFIKGPEIVVLNPKEEREIRIEFLAKRTGVFRFPWYYCVESAAEYDGMQIIEGCGDIYIGDEVIEMQPDE